MQDLLGSFCPFDMVANKPQDWLFPWQDPSVTTINRAPCQLRMNLQPPKEKKKKQKNLCILKLASLQGYLLL